MWIILDPNDEAIGPFPTQEAAEAYGVTTWGDGLDAWDVLALTPPA
jgi:hypothetical protein